MTIFPDGACELRQSGIPETPRAAPLTPGSQEFYKHTVVLVSDIDFSHSPWVLVSPFCQPPEWCQRLGFPRGASCHGHRSPPCL